MNKIIEIHKLANQRLYKEYPLLDMANLEKHPEGSIKIWQVKYILEALETAPIVEIKI